MVYPRVTIPFFRNIGSVELWRDDKRSNSKYEIKYLVANRVCVKMFSVGNFLV